MEILAHARQRGQVKVSDKGPEGRERAEQQDEKKAAVFSVGHEESLKKRHCTSRLRAALAWRDYPCVLSSSAYTVCQKEREVIAGKRVRYSCRSCR